ncbi:MAG TPA: arsinothricin resistance N-acetyltransferase ArsN1 family B [Luteimonas sp.]|nr:arsinothricin resistance N-acetyltransferase ArsN1 family B [Luteimonas sp.]
MTADARAPVEARIRAAGGADAAAIAAIYNHYVATSIATFELEPVAVAEMAARIAQVGARGLPWLLAEDAAGVAGYAYAGPWRARAAYRHSVETSIYLAPRAAGRGIGHSLYAALLDALRDRDVHAVIGGVSLPNPASVALHERMGFAQVARFEEVGFKFGRWIDVGYWQLRLAS